MTANILAVLPTEILHFIMELGEIRHHYFDIIQYLALNENVHCEEVSVF